MLGLVIFLWWTSLWNYGDDMKCGLEFSEKKNSVYSYEMRRCRKINKLIIRGFHFPR